MPTKVAIDAMSGDHGPGVAVAAMRAAVAADPDLELVAVGAKETLEPLVDGSERIGILEAKEVVSMDDEPLKVLRRRESSMFKAIRAVANGEVQAAVSPGNTGALIGMGRIQLKMIEGHHRPAIGGFVPCERCNSSFCMLDLGANVDRSADMLVAFAHLGDALFRAVTGKESPSVALLNIGKEHIKGDKEIKDAGEMLSRSKLNFIGNVEANSIYDHAADVVICDGFTGNVFLKTMEGLAGMIKGMLSDAYSRNIVTKIGALASSPVLNGLRRDMDSRRYNGAAILGLRGLLVKSHGNADELAFQSAIEFTAKQARMDLVRMIDEQEHNRT